MDTNKTKNVDTKKKAKPPKSVQASPDAEQWWICTAANKPMGVYRHGTLASAYTESIRLSKWQRRPALIFECDISGRVERIGKVDYYDMNNLDRRTGLPKVPPT